MLQQKQQQQLLLLLLLLLGSKADPSAPVAVNSPSAAPGIACRFYSEEKRRNQRTKLESSSAASKSEADTFSAKNNACDSTICRSCRDLERERRGLEANEKKIIVEMKKDAKEGERKLLLAAASSSCAQVSRAAIQAKWRSSKSAQSPSSPPAIRFKNSTPWVVNCKDWALSSPLWLQPLQ